MPTRQPNDTWARSCITCVLAIVLLPSFVPVNASDVTLVSRNSVIDFFWWHGTCGDSASDNPTAFSTSLTSDTFLQQAGSSTFINDCPNPGVESLLTWDVNHSFLPEFDGANVTSISSDGLSSGSTQQIVGGTSQTINGFSPGNRLELELMAAQDTDYSLSGMVSDSETDNTASAVKLQFYDGEIFVDIVSFEDESFDNSGTLQAGVLYRIVALATMQADINETVSSQWQFSFSIDSVLLADVNLDGVVNLLDVGPFIALLGSGDYQAEADVNEDGVVNLLDVDPFIEILAGS